MTYRGEETDDGDDVRDEEDVVVRVAEERGGEEREHVDAYETDGSTGVGRVSHVLRYCSLNGPLVDFRRS